MSILCRLGFHDWEHKEGETDSERWGHGVRYLRVEWDQCLRCGLYRNRHWNTWFHGDLPGYGPKDIKKAEKRKQAISEVKRIG